MISFLMPAYKSAFITQAIDSIVNQTSNDWELVVVDDASPEDLESIVAPYCRRFDNIRYYRNATNIGGTDLVKQWNHCLEYAVGDWIVMAGDDDVYDSHFCEECIKLIIKYPNVDLLRSRVKQIDENGERIYGDDGSPFEFCNKYEFLYNWLTALTVTCVGNYVFRKSSLLKIDGFMCFPCAFCSDVATPIALSFNGVANTSEMLFSFRYSRFHLSGNNSKLKEKTEANSKFYRWLSDTVTSSFSNPDNEAQSSVINLDYIHAKCIYDYYNQAIKHVKWADMLGLFKICELASFSEKVVMTLRKVKYTFRIGNE